MIGDSFVHSIPSTEEGRHYLHAHELDCIAAFRSWSSERIELYLCCACERTPALRRAKGRPKRWERVPRR